MNQEPNLLENLKQYVRSDTYPFHMPGHKRRLDIPYVGEFPNPYSIDITEIDGFDNLCHPEGILKESMDWAARIYGADRTYYLVNGSSCGILSAVFGTTTHGGTILMSRNCHKSAYNAVILNHLHVEYSYPQILPEFGLQGGLLASDIENMLMKNREIQAVLVVSPTYDGIVSDIQAIAQVVHRFGLPLIVDEAHGAHFSFGEKGGFPESALCLGADVVIQSVHKTLPSFTQTAVLHVKKGYVDLERLDGYVHMFQSSSPSYLFMAGIEQAIRYMEKRGREQMQVFGEMLNMARRQLEEMKILRLLPCSAKGKAGIFEVDKSKIVISCQGSGMTGCELSSRLRDQYHLEMEMCGLDYVTAITTVADTQEGIDRLVEALMEIDGRLGNLQDVSPGLPECSRYVSAKPVIAMSPAKALECKRRRVKISESEGFISAELVYLYPPGIPMLVPGEQLTNQLIDWIRQCLAMGFSVQGLTDERMETILVADCE